MSLDSNIINLGKRIDALLLFGILSRVKKAIRFFKFKKNGNLVDSTAFLDKETILLGSNKIYSNVRLNKTSVGRFTYIGQDSKIALSTIGSFCSIGKNVSIGLGLHPSSWLSTHPAFFSVRGQTTKTFSEENKVVENIPIRIGHDVWIGANAMVLDGVTIGTGAIVAAGAVVTKDVRPYSIVAGVPAREIKRRFDDKKIEELLAWDWWALPDEDLLKLAQEFKTSGDWTVAELKTVVAGLAKSKSQDTVSIHNA